MKLKISKQMEFTGYLIAGILFVLFAFRNLNHSFSFMDFLLAFGIGLIGYSVATLTIIWSFTRD